MCCMLQILKKITTINNGEYYQQKKNITEICSG
jgi:hypothetical protein